MERFDNWNEFSAMGVPIIEGRLYFPSVPTSEPLLRQPDKLESDNSCSSTETKPTA